MLTYLVPTKLQLLAEKMGNTPQPLPQIPPSKPRQEEDEEHYEDALETQQFTCEICIEPVADPWKKFNNADKCSHPFCTDCMIKYIRVKLEDDHEGDIKCPASSCEHLLDPLACAPLIGAPLFVRWCDVKCEEAIVGWEKCYCPYRICNVLILNECGGNPKKSMCPKCKRWFCFQCKMVWHAGFGCEESGELRDTNEVAFGRLVEQKKWRRCPRCRHFVELRDGCQIIKCRCGISFCYKCGKQVNQHFCSCDTTSVFMGWIARIMLVLCLLIFAFFCSVFAIGRFQH